MSSHFLGSHNSYSFGFAFTSRTWLEASPLPLKNTGEGPLPQGPACWCDVTCPPPHLQHVELRDMPPTYPYKARSLHSHSSLCGPGSLLSGRLPYRGHAIASSLLHAGSTHFLSPPCPVMS